MALVGARRRGLWGDTVVELDSAINHVVRAVRTALGDDASDPSFIETVPRRGYRFAAEVEADSGPDGPDGKPEAARAREVRQRHGAPPTPEATAAPTARPDGAASWGRRLLGVLLLAVLVAGGWFLVRGGPPPGTAIAVFPLRTSEAASPSDTLPAHLTTGLLEALQEVEGVRAVAWSWEMSYDRESGRILRGGDPTGIDFVLDGTVGAEGDSVRISLSLSRVDDGTQLWWRRFLHPAGDPGGALLRVRERVLDEVAENLGPEGAGPR